MKRHGWVMDHSLVWLQRQKQHSLSRGKGKMYVQRLTGCREKNIHENS